MRQAEALESIDEINARSLPKPGRWEQVWLGPSKQWYKVWVPDCYGRPVGVPIPIPEGKRFVPPITGQIYPNMADDVSVPPEYIPPSPRPLPLSLSFCSYPLAVGNLYTKGIR